MSDNKNFTCPTCNALLDKEVNAAADEQPGFEMIWVMGNKFLVGKALATAIKLERIKNGQPFDVQPQQRA